jgi:hypothetical protein
MIRLRLRLSPLSLSLSMLFVGFSPLLLVVCVCGAMVIPTKIAGHY